MSRIDPGVLQRNLEALRDLVRKELIEKEKGNWGERVGERRPGRPAGRRMPIVILHIPHASRRIPSRVRASLSLADVELEDELLRLTDAFTDRLFRLPLPGVVRIVYPVSRLVADPERFLADAQESMAVQGMGAVYMRTSRGTVLRRDLAAEHRQELIERYYRPHHLRLAGAVEAELSRGASVIVDCHSFPSRPLPHEADQDPNRPDICIGTDDFHTPEWLSGTLSELFSCAGFSVALNRPYSGSLVPLRYYMTDARVLSVMVEINRRLYMDEATGRAHRGLGDLKRQLRRVLRGLYLAVRER